MEKKKIVSFTLPENDNGENINIIKRTIKKLHKENKNDVPVFLDGLKDKKNVKEADYDNDFLKYMI